jgi:dTDP-4-dehydrorhamnose 3,5-epimerase
MVINGGKFIDDRGEIQFVNDFDMSEIRRFYTIFHPNISIIRAWQGHKIETRWFFCTEGSFDIRIVKIDNWESPSEDLIPKKFILNANNPTVLKIENGYVNGMKAISQNSKLISFSNFKLGENSNDEFRFDKNLWTNWEE